VGVLQGVFFFKKMCACDTTFVESSQLVGFSGDPPPKAVMYLIEIVEIIPLLSYRDTTRFNYNYQFTMLEMFHC